MAIISDSVKDKTINKIIIGSGVLVGALVLAKYASAETQGNIVASEPLMFGQCIEGACLTDTEVIAYVTFKNVGELYKENVVGIRVNDVMVKEQPVGLNPGTGFTMSYTFTIGAGANNICGIVR
jgi:hypothetical protein